MHKHLSPLRKEVSLHPEPALRISMEICHCLITADSSPPLTCPMPRKHALVTIVNSTSFGTAERLIVPVSVSSVTADCKKGAQSADKIYCYPSL